MKRTNWWSLVTMAGLVVILIILVISSGSYNKLKKELEASQGQNTGLNSQLAQSQSSLSSLQGDYDTLNASFNTLTYNYNAVSQELATLKARPVASNFSSVAELETWLRADPISTEPWATTWLDLYDKALRLQQAAADDGYIVSVQYHFCDEQGILEYIVCTTNIGGFLWRWWPEDDEVYPDPIFGP